MQEFIRDKMEQIHTDFLISISQEDQLCFLKDLRFNAGHLPDYTNTLVQQRYLLRFLPAYMVEYYNLYSRLIEMDFLVAPWKVLSIGSGSGLDYYGLYYACSDAGLGFNQWVHYTGIDQVQWGYIDHLGNPNARFLHQNIIDMEELRLDRGDYNVIMFPKSIGELDTIALFKLRYMIRRTHFTHDKIAIVGSLRETNIYHDMEALERILKAFEEMGYEILDRKRDWYEFPNQALISLFPNHFCYPEDARDTLLNLSNLCPTKRRQGYNCESSCGELNRQPILKGAHVRYQIFRLQRTTKMPLDDELPF